MELKDNVAGSAQRWADADQVVLAFVTEPRLNHPTFEVELVWAKHRHEPNKTIRVEIDPATMQVIN